MGFVSYLEDITESLNQSFATVQLFTDDLEQCKSDDIEFLRSELNKIKLETHGLLKVLNEQVLPLLNDPHFEVFGEWQVSLTENTRLKADNIIIAGKYDSLSKEAKSLKSHMSQAERVAFETLMQAESKNKELQELKSLFLRIQSQIKLQNADVARLTQENVRLKQQLDEANELAFGKAFQKIKPQPRK